MGVVQTRPVRARKPGAVAFYFGFGLLGLALFVSLLIGFVPGAPLWAIAIGLLAYGLTKSGRKAAGRVCAGCARKIVFEHEAEFCDRCNLPVHAACAAPHAASAHKLDEGHPFR